MAMAYSLKSVRFHDKTFKVLLQNENGPCPLLAAANVLLLSSQITLPESSIRNNVASIDDVVNMLAGHALKRQNVPDNDVNVNTNVKNTSTSTSTPSNKSVDATIQKSKEDDVDNDKEIHVKSDTNTTVDTDTTDTTDADTTDVKNVNAIEDTTTAHHIHELLTLFPNLQYGMDVNPKFTLGPTGAEYTSGLGAFDIMGVELLHGWLVDIQQESEIANVIGNKTYNELVELVIEGNEAMAKTELLRKEIEKVEHDIDMNVLKANQKQEEEGKKEEEDVAEIQEQQQQQQQQQESTQEEEQQEEQQHDLTKTLEEITRNDEEIANQENLKQQEQDKILRKLQQELNEQILLAEHGSIIKHFLDTTSHQLTFSGLLELHSYAQEGKLYVFFRNNHFATLTKHGGILYLLVTDLGYANVNDVVWEKIDDIKGDTDLFDANFCKTKAQAVHVPVGGPNLSPEQLLAQRGQSDVDYQLALELSRNDGNGQANSNALAQREGDLIAAATELSLQSYDNEQRVLSVEDTLASSQGGNLGNMKKESDKVTGTAEHNNVHNNVYTTNSTHDLLAEQMRLEKQREESDMEMAKKLQAAYNQVDRSRVSPQAAPAADESGCIRRRQPPPAAKQDSGCTIC